MKIAIIHENLELPYDEGMKNVVSSFIRYCNKGHDVLAITNNKNNDKSLKIEYQKMNLFFINILLLKRIKRFSPDKIFYFPHSSTTFFAFLRCKIIEVFTNIKVVCVSLQRREYKLPFNYLINIVKSHLVLTASKEYLNFLKERGFNVKLIPFGVDTNKFVPVNKSRKKNLRKKYILPVKKRIFLHVGHLKDERGIPKLLRIANDKDNLLLLVVSSTYKKECRIPKKDNLVLITGYQKNIEELYQLSDCYIFLTEDYKSCIDVPLSVLEAMSCNIPVITTPFGGLKWMFKPNQSLIYTNNSKDILSDTKNFNPKPKIADRNRVIENYDWNKIFEDMLRSV